MFPDGGNCPDGTLMHLNVFRNVWRQSKRRVERKEGKRKDMTLRDVREEEMH